MSGRDERINVGRNTRAAGGSELQNTHILAMGPIGREILSKVHRETVPDLDFHFLIREAAAAVHEHGVVTGCIH